MHADEDGLAEVATGGQACTIKVYLEQVRWRHHSKPRQRNFEDHFLRTIDADFKIVDVPNSPSILGCKQALELGLITLNVNSLNVTPPVTAVTKNEIAATGKLTRSDVPKSYGDCFDKIGKFPGEKYTIKLIEDATPVVHAPRTVPVHIMPL